MNFPSKWDPFLGPYRQNNDSEVRLLIYKKKQTIENQKNILLHEIQLFRVTLTRQSNFHGTAWASEVCQRWPKMTICQRRIFRKDTTTEKTATFLSGESKQ